MASLSTLLRKHGLLILIVTAGVILRVGALGGESLWRDEGITVQLTQQSVGEIVRNRASDNHTPLYFVFLHYWVKLFGDSEFSLRLPSAIAGAIAVFLMYRLGLLLFDRKTALIAAALLCVSFVNIRLSREARMYSIVVMLVILSMQAFIHLQRRWSVRAAAGYLFSSVLLLYTHPYGVFFLIVQNVFFLFRVVTRKAGTGYARSWLILQGTTGLLFLPWMLVIIGQLLRREAQKATNWLDAPTLRSLGRTFVEYSSKSILLTAVYFLLCVLAVWILLSRAGLVRESRAFESGDVPPGGGGMSAGEVLLLLLTWLGIPILVPFLLSQFVSPMYTHRYAVGVTTAMYLLVAVALRFISQRVIRCALVLMILALSVFPLVAYYRGSLRTPYYRELTRDINLQAREADWVVVYQHDVALYEYYGLRRDLQLYSYSRADGPAETLPAVPNSGSHALWLVTYAGPDKFSYLDTSAGRYRLVARREYRSNLALLQYERSSRP